MCQEAVCDAKLIKEHLQGSSTALAQLWLRYNRLVFGIAHSLVCNREVADDLRQEVFLKVYEQLAELRDPTKFVGWLRNITYNTCYSWLRRHRHTEPLESLSDTEHPQTASVEVDVERREQRTLLRQMIHRLPEKFRTVIELRYFEGRSEAQIAQFLGLAESTIRWRVRTARQMLRQTAEINGYLE